MHFTRNARRATPSIMHFQLRHLVTAASNHAVLTMSTISPLLLLLLLEPSD